MDSKTPFADGGPDDGDEVPYKWLDEWLCEYVDGTMDPSLEAVFEQYVEANPELKDHVQRLKQTREMLCECSLPPPSSEADAPVPPPPDEDFPSPPSPSPNRGFWDRPFVVAGMASSVTLALVIGFLVGATMVDRGAASSSANAVHSSPTERPAPAAEQSSSEPVPLFLKPNVEAPSDSSNASSPLTTIGIP